MFLLATSFLENTFWMSYTIRKEMSYLFICKVRIFIYEFMCYVLQNQLDITFELLSNAKKVLKQ